jgi:thymidylate kinase
MTPQKAQEPQGKLITVDGVEPAAVLTEARSALRSGSRGGISTWDASGVFQELAVADEAAGTPSARTLLLLYAADLAFRLRWQIRPALAEGRIVVAAPYVDTALAFGRAAGLTPSWLMNLFRFAPRAQRRLFAHTTAGRAAAVRDGFVGFSAGRMAGDRASRRRILAQTAAELRGRFDRRH